MKVPKHTGPKWNAAEREARRQAAQTVAAKHAAANSMPALKALVQELAKAVGVLPPKQGVT